jgi:hypothetical protein
MPTNESAAKNTKGTGVKKGDLDRKELVSRKVI